MLNYYQGKHTDLEKLTGINNVTLYNMLSGATKKPTMSTISKLEAGLKIKINVSDPEIVTYKNMITANDLKTDSVLTQRYLEKEPYNTLLKAHEPESVKKLRTDNTTKIKLFNGEHSIIMVPIISSVHAGFDKYSYSDDVETIPFVYDKPHNIFALKVLGESMNHTLAEGDIVIIDPEATIVNNNIVAVKTKDGQQIIKRYKRLSNNKIVLYGDNQDTEPRFFDDSDIEILVRVVNIIKSV